MTKLERENAIRKRQAKKRKRRLRRLAFLFSFIIILLLCVGITLSLTVFFPIENIIIKGSNVYNDEQVIDALDIKKEDNLFRFSSDSVKTNLKSKLPYAETVTIKRSIPDTLSVTIKDAKEYEAFNINDKFYVVSNKGIVLNSYDSLPENVILVKLQDVKCEISKPVQIKSEKKANILNSLSTSLDENSFKINYIDLESSISIKAKVNDRFIVDYGSANYIDKKTAHLMGMIKKISEEKTGVIDLSMWTSSNTEGTFVEKSIE